MLTLEDLYVASQAKRYGLIDTERLRALLLELSGQQERVQLVRILHDRFALPLEQSKGLYDQAMVYLRQRSEERYAQFLKRGVPAERVDAAASEQAAAGYAWTLGDRFLKEGAITQAQHAQIQGEIQRQLDEEDAALVSKNLKYTFAPILGPRPDASPNMAVSGHLPALNLDAPIDADAEMTMQLSAGSLGELVRPEEELAQDGLKTMELDRPDGHGYGPPPESGSGEISPLGGSFVSPLGAPEASVEEDELSFDVGAPTIQLGPGAVAQALGVPGGSGLGPAPGQGSGFGPPPGSESGAPPAGNPFGTVQFDPATGQAVANPGGPAASGGALAPGSVLGGRFTLQRELGRGAMGVVYLATDPQQGEVAIKLVQGPVTDEVRGRFEREIAVSKRAVHPNVIEVFDHGELPDGSSWMSMEVLGGQSMQGLILREGPQSVERALSLIEQTLKGLEAVHQAGIVHRDLKPENLQILETPSDHVKIVDFGVSRFLDGESPEAEQMFQTVRGQLSGTPQYVAPEAVLEPDVVLTGHDVYACGVSLYELLTGVLPFPPARNLRDMLSNTVNARAIPLEESYPAGAPYAPALERFVRRLLEKDPEARPADASAALELLADTREQLAGGGAGQSGRSQGGGFTKRLMRSITNLFRKSEG